MRRGVSLPARRRRTALAVLAEVNQRVRAVQTLDAYRMDGIVGFADRMGLTRNHDGPGLALIAQLAFDFEILAAWHPANHAAEVWAGADDAMPVGAWIPLVVTEVPNARDGRQQQDCERILLDVVGTGSLGIAAEESAKGDGVGKKCNHDCTSRGRTTRPKPRRPP